MTAIEHTTRRPSDARARARRSLAATAVALTLTLAASACDEDATTSADTATCQSIVASAARQSELPRQVELLDEAIATCAGVDALDVELQTHRGLVGFDTGTFVAGRCARTSSEATRTSAICAAAATPVDDGATASTVPSYTGQTLDGRTVEITADQVPFVEGKPQPIVQLVDVAAEDGCTGLAQERDRWAALVGDPIVGDQASVYARHADNVAAFIGCNAPATTAD